MKYDVFISHSSSDLEISLAVCDYLESHGLKCWIDSRNITGSYARSIIEGIQASEVMVLIYSGKSNDSMHVENEIDNAFGYGKIIIPFRIESVPYSQVLQYYLSKAHYVDGHPQPMEAFEELLKQVNRNLKHQRKIDAVNESIASLSEWINISPAVLKNMLATMKKGMEVPELTHQICSLTSVFSSRVRELMAGPEQPEKTEATDPDRKPEGSSMEAPPENNDKEKDTGGQTYNIFSNKNGELLIITTSGFTDEPENPRIVYDGGNSALYYRSRNSSVVLDNIAIPARAALMAVDSVTVAEMTKDKELIRDLTVPLRKVDPIL